MTGGRAPVPEPTLGHEALLTLARKTEAAALDGDRARLEAAAAHLLRALDAHVGAERADVGEQTGPDRRVLALGQQHLGALIEELEAAVSAGGECRCVALAQRLSAELRVQADGERLAGVPARRRP